MLNDLSKYPSCEICGEITSFERNSADEPYEGEFCFICERWICFDCSCGEECYICKFKVDTDEYKGEE